MLCSNHTPIDARLNLAQQGVVLAAASRVDQKRLNFFLGPLTTIPAIKQLWQLLYKASALQREAVLVEKLRIDTRRSQLGDGGRFRPRRYDGRTSSPIPSQRLEASLEKTPKKHSTTRN
jgi:hypothetical protein